MTTPSEDAMKDKGTWERWKKRHRVGFTPEQIMKRMENEKEPHPFTKNPNNPWLILKREREIREAGEQ